MSSSCAAVGPRTERMPVAVIDVAGFVADLKSQAIDHGFHVHDERHFVETYSLRQLWEVDLHPEEACSGPIDLHLSLDVDPRAMLGFEDEVMKLEDVDEPPPAGSRLVAQPDHLDRANFDTVEALAGFAAERNLDLVTVAIGGLAAMPTVGSVIAGATSVEQVQSNVAAGLWSPTPAELLELLEKTEPS